VTADERSPLGFSILAFVKPGDVTDGAHAVIYTGTYEPTSITIFSGSKGLKEVLVLEIRDKFD
jgi:hypothetical protein